MITTCVIYNTHVMYDYSLCAMSTMSTVGGLSLIKTCNSSLYKNIKGTMPNKYYKWHENVYAFLESVNFKESIDESMKKCNGCINGRHIKWTLPDDMFTFKSLQLSDTKRSHSRFTQQSWE